MNVTAINHPLPVVSLLGSDYGPGTGIVPPWLQDPEPIRILPMPDGWNDEGNYLPVEPYGTVARQINTAFEPWPIEN